jgi:hypothetical protein
MSYRLRKVLAAFRRHESYVLREEGTIPSFDASRMGRNWSFHDTAS